MFSSRQQIEKITCKQMPALEDSGLLSSLSPEPLATSCFVLQSDTHLEQNTSGRSCVEEPDLLPHHSRLQAAATDAFVSLGT